MNPVRLALCLPLALLSACAVPGSEEECDDVEHVAEACREVHCGEPTVEFGTGHDSFEPVEPGGEMVAVFGGQGGYHFDVATRMTQMCDLVWIRTRLYADLGSGLETILDEERYREADRVDVGHWSTQEFLGNPVLIPCEHWPNDPDRDPYCNTGEPGEAGPINELDVVMRVEVRDRDDRSAVEEKPITAVCCEDGTQDG